ncbi:GNAT family N-acetyltransferase [Bacillus sp. AK031]
MNWKLLEGSGYSTVEWANLDTGIRIGDVHELLDILERLPDENKVSVVVPIQEGGEGLVENLLKTGFHMVKERNVFARSLRDITEFPDTPVTYIPENESRALSSLSSILGSQKEARTMLNALHEEIELGKFCMYNAVIEGEDAGVFLSHIEPFTRAEGRLFFFGVVPEFQGRGLAASMHRFALATLKLDLNAKSYIGVTDGGNQAMKKIFLQNGCSQIHTIRIYSR